MGHNPTVIRPNTLINRQIHQLPRLGGLGILGIILEIGNQRHDAVQRLVLAGPAPVPRLEIRALGEPQEAVDVLAAEDDDAEPSSQWAVGVRLGLVVCGEGGKRYFGSFLRSAGRRLWRRMGPYMTE